MPAGWADGIIVPVTALCEESDPEAQRWIIHVIMNRCRLNPVRFGSTMSGVCVKAYQFSEWLSDRGDNANLERVLTKSAGDPAVQGAIELYLQCLTETDPTGNATHFYAVSIPPPSWTEGATFTGRQGSTKFYANVA